jgi:RNA recognition motif-containing protein
VDPYCFVEFYDHSSAAAALAAMNKRMCLGRVSVGVCNYCNVTQVEEREECSVDGLSQVSSECTDEDLKVRNINTNLDSPSTATSLSTPHC